MTSVKPRPVVAATRAYARPERLAPIDLRLDGNEGPAPDAALFDVLRDPELVRRYPSTAPLRARLAERMGVGVDRLLVTAGADDAIDRVCRAMLAEGDNAVVPAPSFEMTRRYVALAGATTREVAWSGARFPTDEAIAAIDERTRLVVVTTPNNPTGAVATADDLRRLSEAAPEALLLVDLAYGELADEDLTPAALALDNAVVLRTLSKAWGLAGLRVGYAIGTSEVIGWLRAAGPPYAVSGPAVALACARLEQPAPDAYVARVKEERVALRELLTELGADAAPSQANFVFLRSPRAAWIRDALAAQGIAVRTWPNDPALADAVRITCPGNAADFERLTAALRVALAPEAILFDADGVLVDVSDSYRRAIAETAASFEVSVTPDDIDRVKRAGDANNDWVVTQRLIEASGREVPFERVRERFESLYQGGLWKRERLLVDAQRLRAIGLPLAIVTGRPRGDAERLIDQFELGGVFDAIITMDDAPAKPDPAPVKLAMEKLGVSRAWMFGDTPDDVRAAGAAGVVPVGIAAEAETTRALLEAGAACVRPSVSTLEVLA